MASLNSSGPGICILAPAWDSLPIPVSDSSHERELRLKPRCPLLA